MLNKIAVLMFVGVVSVTSIPALAASREAVYHSAKPLVAANIVANQNVKIQVVNAASDANQYNAGIGKGDATLPPTGWLLGLALLGFVMLSNRSGI